MRRVPLLLCAVLALPAACGTGSSSANGVAPPSSGPDAPAPADPGPAATAADGTSTPATAPASAPPGRAEEAECEGLVPTRLPPAVEYSEAPLPSDLCAPGTSDAHARFVALPTEDGLASSSKWPRYRFVPSSGGDPTPYVIGTHQAEMFGAHGFDPAASSGRLWARERGYFWLPRSGGMLVRTIGPLLLLDDRGARLGLVDVEPPGSVDDVRPAPWGGGVATTTTYHPGAELPYEAHLVTFDEAGSVVATFDRPAGHYSSYNPITILAVNARGHTLAWFFASGLRWFDQRLVPLTDVFPLPNQQDWSPDAFALADGSVVLVTSGDGSSFLLADASTSAGPAPGWFSERLASFESVQAVRGGRAYAVFSNRDRDPSATRRIELLAATGRSCGTISLPVAPCSEISIGLDGTVFAVTHTGATDDTCAETPEQYWPTRRCTWRWWPGLLGAPTRE